MLINPYCSNRGWLFEDFKEAFGAMRMSAPWRHEDGEYMEPIIVKPSDDPLPDADAWICIRTDELGRSPDLSRTVVQVHDFWEHPEFPKETGAIFYVHEHQIDTTKRELRAYGMLENSLIPFQTMPIGARSAFKLRTSMPEHFTVGWTGRNMIYKGQNIKRPHLLREALERLWEDKVDVRCICLSPDEPLGPSVEYWKPDRGPSRTPSLEQLQKFYESIDMLVVTSLPEPGPLSIFEALRCGVPVILPTRHAEPLWEERLLTAGRVEVCTMPGMLPFALKRFDRESHFDRRLTRRNAMPYLQEDWIEANVQLAVEVAHGG